MWDSVIGHEEQKKFLARYLYAAERPHALLFTGPAGIGKRLLAYQFARSFLCASKSGTDNCESCRRLDFEGGSVTHPDFLVVKRQADNSAKRLKDIGIGQMRELISRSALKSVLSPFAVCIVEDADHMTAEAADSFLKLLEEPPAGWVIILIAEDEAALTPTVLSRLAKVRFAPLAADLTARILAGKNIEAEEAGLLARLGDGSPGLALALKEQEVLSVRKEAWEFLASLPLDTPLNYLAAKPWQGKDYGREKAVLFTSMLQLLLHDLVMIKSGLEEDLRNTDLAAELKKGSAQWDFSALRQSLAATEEAYFALTASAGVRMVLEALALKIDQAYKE